MHPLTNKITGNLYSHSHAVQFWRADNNGSFNEDHRLKVLTAKSSPNYKSRLKKIMMKLTNQFKTP